jgi:hypothetical protein
LYLIVIAGKIKYQQALVRLKNEPPSQASPALIKAFSQLPYRKSGMCVRMAKAFHNSFKGGRHLRLSSAVPHNLFESPGEFNGNHYRFP